MSQNKEKSLFKTLIISLSHTLTYHALDFVMSINKLIRMIWKQHKVNQLRHTLSIVSQKKISSSEGKLQCTFSKERVLFLLRKVRQWVMIGWDVNKSCELARGLRCVNSRLCKHWYKWFNEWSLLSKYPYHYIRYPWLSWYVVLPTTVQARFWTAHSIT